MLSLARAAIPALLRRPEPRTGRFLAVASAAAARGLPMLAAYCAAKAGVTGLIRALAAELGGTGITANAVSPGSTDTPILAESARLYGLPGAQSFAAQQPVQRLIDPDEVAAALVWLAPARAQARSPAPSSPSTAAWLCRPLGKPDRETRGHRLSLDPDRACNGHAAQAWRAGPRPRSRYRPVTAKRGRSVSGPGQFVRAAVGERDPGSDDQVFDGPRDEDLARLRLGGDAADDVNRDSPDLVADQVHFTCVDPGA